MVEDRSVRHNGFTTKESRNLIGKRTLVDIIIISICGSLLIALIIIWALPTGTFMDDGWHTFHAEPGHSVKLIVITNEDPVVIYIVDSETAGERNWNYEEPTDHIRKYVIPPNSRETIELQLPEDGIGNGSWGFMFYKENGYASISYRQTQPVVMDHFWYTWVPMALLTMVLVTGLGINQYLRWVETRDPKEPTCSFGTNYNP